MDIERTYRKLQRNMLKQLDPSKKFMYWMNSASAAETLQ